MKKFTKILALCVSVAALSAAFAGCNRKSSDSKTATSANWNVRTSSAVEHDSVDFWRNNKEVATYSVSFTRGSNPTYSVVYTPETVGGDRDENDLVKKTYMTDGAYSTAFYIDKNDYDWAADTVPENFRMEDKTSIVYVYETTFTVSGKYVLSNGTEGETFTDKVTSICKFRLAGENLKPVYSKQVIKNTAARNLSASNLEEACISIDAEYETFYNFKCNKAITYTCEHTEDGDKNTEKTYSVGGSQSVFDNSQLKIAARAMALSSSSTKTFKVAVPQNGVTQSCSAAVSSSVQLSNETEEGKKITAVLDSADGYIFFKDNSTDENKPRNYRFNAVNFSLNAKMAGTSVTNWYASMENADINYTRCVMLKTVSPLSFSMGTLSYTITNLAVEAF